MDHDNNSFADLTIPYSGFSLDLNKILVHLEPIRSSSYFRNALSTLDSSDGDAKALYKLYARVYRDVSHLMDVVELDGDPEVFLAQKLNEVEAASEGLLGLVASFVVNTSELPEPEIDFVALAELLRCRRSAFIPYGHHVLNLNKIQVHLHTIRNSTPFRDATRGDDETLYKLYAHLYRAVSNAVRDVLKLEYSESDTEKFLSDQVKEGDVEETFYDLVAAFVESSRKLPEPEIDIQSLGTLLLWCP